MCLDLKCWLLWTVTGTLFYDAGADAVCALQLLGPHPTKPSSPIFELACPRIFTAMRDYDARAITEQDGITSFTNHLI